MDGASLAARFSLATNRLQYCGPSDAEPVLYDAIVRGRGLAEAREKLLGFEALAPYLELLGRHHGLDPFDERVVEAYWIGHDLLEGFRPAEFAELFEAFRRRGLPRSIARRLEEHLPEDAIPHHAFHVSYVGVGTVTGHVPTTLENIEACRPALREVREVGGGRLQLRGPRAVMGGGSLALGPPVEEERAYDPLVLPEVAPGDYVVGHWGWPALVLSDRQRAALVRSTDRAWASASRAWPGLGAAAAALPPDPKDVPRS